MYKVLRNNPFNKIIPIIIASVVAILFIMTSLFGSGFVYQTIGVYPYWIYKRLIILFLICLIVSNYLRVSFLRTIKIDKNLVQIILTRSKFNKSLALTNFLIMIIFCKIYFYFSGKSFFVGTDGQHMLALNEMHSDFHDPVYYFTSNFFQGLGGNIPFPVNHRADIGYIIGNIGPDFNVSNALTTWFIFFAFSVFTLCISLQINLKTSCIASWIAPILSMLPTSFVFTLIPTLTPHMLTSIGVNNFILSAILLKTNTFLKSAFRSLAIFLLCLYYLVTNPTFILLSLPILLFVTFFSLVGLQKKLLIQEIITIFTPVALVSILGGLVYMSGIFLNTSVLFFKDEFTVSDRPLNTISVLFSRRELTRSIFIFALITAFWLYKNKLATRNLRALIKALFTFVSIIVLLGMIYSINPNLWLGPAPIYFEFMMWGIYSLFLSVLIAHYLSKIRKYFETTSKIATRNLEKLVYFIPSFIIFVYLLSLSVHQNSNYSGWTLSKASNRNSIVEFLESHNYKSRSEFHGRTITVFNPTDSSSLNWNDIDKEGRKYFKEYGTDFMQATMWIRKIPTVFEVNQLITPRSYFALTRNLARVNDQQLRDFTFLRNINEDYLRQIGVKYLISNKKLKIGQLLLSENSNGLPVLLYEIPRVNIGNYFAVKTIQIRSFSEAERFFKDSDLAKNHTAMVEDNVKYPNFVPPIKSELIIDGNKYEVRAQSAGKTLLILPIEYSNCFRFKNVGNSNLLKSIPVDITQLGLIFDKNLHLQFQYVNGPFNNSGCRLSDYMGFKKLVN